MHCNVIATGSTGNCVVLNDVIAIDMGIPYKKIAPYAKKLKLVLLTHVHSDHFNPATVRRLCEERPTLRVGCASWMVWPLRAYGIDPRRINVVYEPNLVSLIAQYTFHIPVIGSNGEVERVDDVIANVEAFPLFHDVENIGYKIQIGSERALYATDTGSMDGVEAKDYDWYLIEANHTEAEIQERIQRKLKAGEFVYEYRAAAGHLSKEKADAWLAQNATPGKSKVVYLHGHMEVKHEFK